MSSQRAYSIYVAHIVEAGEAAQQFLGDMTLEELLADMRTRYASVRAIEIIGEATKRLPPEIRALDESIPWRDMAGMRDRVIHQYDDVDFDVVWRTIHEILPPLLPRLKRLQHALEEREDEEWERGRV